MVIPHKKTPLVEPLAPAAPSPSPIPSPTVASESAQLGMFDAIDGREEPTTEHPKQQQKQPLGDGDISAEHPPSTSTTSAPATDASEPSVTLTSPSRRTKARASAPQTKSGVARKDTADDVQFAPDLDITQEVATAVREPTSYTDIKPNELAAIIPSRPGIALDHNSIKAWLLMHDFSLEQGLRDQDIRVFRSPVVRLEREAGINSKDRRGLKKSLRDLVGATVEWNTPRVNAKGETTEWEVSAMLASAKFLYDQNHTLVVEWSYSETLRDKLKLAGPYFRMRLKSLRETRTYGGWALYLYLSRYRTFPGARTDTKNWRHWVPILTGKHLSDFDKSDKENVGNSWRYFHRDVVRKAVAEVNSIQTDYRAVEKFVKSGLRVTDLWFELHALNVEQAEEAKPATSAVIDRIMALDYKERETKRILTSSRREDVLNALDYVEKRFKATTGHKIINKRAYFRTMLSKFATGEIKPEDGKPENKVPEQKSVQNVAQMDGQVRKLLEAWALKDINDTLAKGINDEKAAELIRIFETEHLPSMHERTQKSWASKGLANSIVRQDVVSWLAMRIHPIPSSHEELVMMGIRHGIISLASLQQPKT